MRGEGRVQQVVHMSIAAFRLYQDWCRYKCCVALIGLVQSPWSWAIRQWQPGHQQQEEDWRFCHIERDHLLVVRHVVWLMVL
jgi:hypothetical protein